MSQIVDPRQLLKSILSNVDRGTLYDFLEIQCGFSTDEAIEWVEQAEAAIAAGG